MWQHIRVACVACVIIMIIIISCLLERTLSRDAMKMSCEKNNNNNEVKEKFKYANDDCGSFKYSPSPQHPLPPIQSCYSLICFAALQSFFLGCVIKQLFPLCCSKKKKKTKKLEGGVGSRVRRGK